MARQTFTKGQTVYVNHYGSNWRKAIVANPDVIQTPYGYGSSDRHYVAVSYVERDGRVDPDRTWDIANNRLRIISEERHAEIAQAKDIHTLRRDILRHKDFEASLDKYTEQARIIIGRKRGVTLSDETMDVAIHLLGLFAFRSEHSRMTREQVIARRTEGLADAHSAQAALRELGEEVPEL